MAAKAPRTAAWAAPAKAAKAATAVPELSPAETARLLASPHRRRPADVLDRGGGGGGGGAYGGGGPLADVHAAARRLRVAVEAGERLGAPVVARLWPESARLALWASEVMAALACSGQRTDHALAAEVTQISARLCELACGPRADADRAAGVAVAVPNADRNAGVPNADIVPFMRTLEACSRATRSARAAQQAIVLEVARGVVHGAPARPLEPEAARAAAAAVRAAVRRAPPAQDTLRLMLQWPASCCGLARLGVAHHAIVYDRIEADLAAAVEEQVVADLLESASATAHRVLAR